MDRLGYIRRQAKYELARRYFYDYNTLKYSRHYTEDRKYLKDVCNRVQAFSEQNSKRFLIINMPPRHYKSFTAGNFVEWKLGKDPSRKTMTGSYNEILSTTFARKVRDTIDEKPSDGILVYRNIFPNTRVKYGQASASRWALEGSSQDNYLATSPSGTATGFGANDIVIDDIIKNAEEAYNEVVLDRHWSWFANTMLSRTEGNDWKVYVFMTRWAKGDLAGRIIDAYDDEVEVITYKAIQDDGSMLCDSILNRPDFKLKTREMNRDIVEANYNQEPIDVKGRLYNEFKTHNILPPDPAVKKNYTDTADKGTDFLCSVNWEMHEGDVYITDIYHSDEAMEETEPEVARMIHSGGINEATIESNNGGRGFGRNVKRIIEDKYESNRTVFIEKNQTANKEARILSSSAWVQEHVHMPDNWKQTYPDFYSQLMAYQRKGKNAHDDAPDVLAGIYELATEYDIEYWGVR